MNLIANSQAWMTLTDATLWQSTLRQSTPLALAALGGVISERSGVVNIAMEGMMLTGAFFAIVFDLLFNNAAMGLLGGMAMGGMMSLVLAFGAIRLRADQVIMGMAINLLALGLTSYLFFGRYFAGTPQACTPPTPCGKGQLLTIPDWSIPVLNKIPGVGVILFQQNPIVYLMLGLVVVTHLFLFRTTLGLRIRAVGEKPRAVDTAGVNVQSLRYLAVSLSGLLSGLAGGYLALAVAYGFTDNMTSGRGFIALAAMIFGKWTPFGAFGACLLFGWGTALYINLQNTSGALQNYSPLLAALPYVLTIVALAGFIGRAIPPAADGIPYDSSAAG